MKLLFTLAIVLSVASAMVSIDRLLEKEDKELMNKFATWLIKHRKTSVYRNEYEAYARFQIFKKNLEEIERLNNEDLGATFGLNKFSDLSHEEFMGMYANLDIPENPDFLTGHRMEAAGSYDAAPESFDWRDHGAVTKVKDQGQCGSCWAFGTIAAIEGQYFLKSKTLRSFSEEELVDCDKVDEGCNGGLQENAFKFLETHGFMLESDYPYTSGTGFDYSKHKKCRYNADKTYGTVKTFSHASKNEVKIAETLAQEGPLTNAVNANLFQHYRSGILKANKRKCGNTREDLNHAVTLVGYGAEGETDYWLIKNSWAADWGEKGYIRLARGENTCGCADMVMTVEVNVTK